MNEQNITILNEKQDKALTDIMEHIKDEMFFIVFHMKSTFKKKVE